MIKAVEKCIEGEGGACLAKKEDRQRQILTALDAADVLDVDTLAQMFSLTPTTIRRDLTELEGEGRVIRTHGGVRLNGDPAAVARRFGDRKTMMVEEKKRMARAAAAEIPAGASVMMDSGTSNLFFTKLLKRKEPLMVVTNSLGIMLEIAGADTDIELVLAGGVYRKRNLDFVGTPTSDTLRGYYVDYAVLTCDGYRPGQGFYKKSADSAAIARTMCACAGKVFVLADETKYEAPASHLFAADAEVDTLFTTCDIAAKGAAPAYRVVCC